jgi:hypothetical protein
MRRFELRITGWGVRSGGDRFVTNSDAYGGLAPEVK